MNEKPEVAGLDTFTPHRAGYGDALAMALRQARKGGTLAAGEGLLIVQHFEALVEAAFMEGLTHNGTLRDSSTWKYSDARKALEAR